MWPELVILGVAIVGAGPSCPGRNLGCTNLSEYEMLAPMPGPLRVHGTVVIPETDLSWRFSRSSGPGGQGVNTTDSRVELSYDVERGHGLGPLLLARALERLGDRLVDGVITVVASEHRSQWHNRLAAERRLAAILAAAIAPPPRPRRPTRPSRGAVERRITEKKQRGETKRQRGAPPRD